MNYVFQILQYSINSDLQGQITPGIMQIFIESHYPKDAFI